MGAQTPLRTELRLAVGLALCAACNAPAAKSAASKPDLAPTKIEAPEHVTLQMACTPTGPELCFNAIDDNCNGIIDEGCGGETGVLQWTIAWNEEAANVDLSVVDPGGNAVNAQRRSSPTGLRLDRDCPGAPSASESCGGQNTENVFFEGLEPPRGRYLVEVRLIDPHGAAAPIVVHFGARIGARTYGATLSLLAGEEYGQEDVQVRALTPPSSFRAKRGTPRLQSGGPSSLRDSG